MKEKNLLNKLIFMMKIINFYKIKIFLIIINN